MRLKRVCSIFLLAAVIAGLILDSGCTKKVNSKALIGFSMDTLVAERWYKDRDEFVSKVKSLQADVIVDVAYDNEDEQIKQVKDMLSKGIRTLVLIPHNASTAAAAVSLAKKAGVKVISYDRLVRNAKADLYISFDNYKVGQLQAKSILAAKPQGNYVIINGPQSDYNAVMINQGIKSVLNPQIKSGKINIVREISSNDWLGDEASDGIAKLLQDGITINAVIAENDSLAGGAINTLLGANLIPSVPVVGMDADLAACQRIVEGQQLMTVYKPIHFLADKAAEYAVLLAKGEKIAAPATIDDGKYKIPYYAIEPEAVDASNMASTVIKDGFHKKSEVYMNIPESEWPAG